ncbi:hypothetical protein SAMN05444161_7148 [Rhizobiales bacterium GAS191]|jgi:hypothetical protein|nr:hypothetical protein SAMN05444161_7148 [Rhizobiales bacterium GAS191]
MDGVTGFIGGLFCKIPLGITQCSSIPERIIIGRWVVAALALIAFYFLMRNPRRA